MTKKELGHIELQWTCPNCNGVNPGPVRLCQSCGAPQPEDVEFHQPVRQELITDEEKIAQAEAGADIHCGFCGSRNPAGTVVCRQCGGDLAEGQQRAAGRVVGAFQTGPATEIACPHCGSANPGTAIRCANCNGSLAVPPTPEAQVAPPAASPPPRRKANPLVIVGLVAVMFVVCGGIALLAFLGSRTTEMTGTVQDVYWERSIAIEALVPASYQDWYDDIPQGAELGSCRSEVRSIQADPAPNSVEVCGTPYTIDTGGGFAEVVQDCEYHVYDEQCSYTIDEWQTVEVVKERGEDLAPYWPQPILAAGERLGQDTDETYVCIFDTAEGEATYRPSDERAFQGCQLGSTWTLTINGFGDVVNIER